MRVLGLSFDGFCRGFRNGFADGRGRPRESLEARFRRRLSDKSVTDKEIHVELTQLLGVMDPQMRKPESTQLLRDVLEQRPEIQSYIVTP